MKKLLILASAAVMVGMANAANYTWGYGNYEIEDPAGNPYTLQQSAYLLSGVVGQTQNADGTYSLDFGTLEIVASTLADGSEWNYGAFSYDADRASDKIAYVTPGTTGTDKYTLLLLDNEATILDLDGLKNYEGSYVAKDIAGVGTSDAAENKWTAIEFGDPVAQGDWRMAAAVPEPTSGLLLLLGVAGLALRRRRA